MGGCGGWTGLGGSTLPALLPRSQPTLSQVISPSLLSSPSPAHSSSAVSSYKVAPAMAKNVADLLQGRVLLCYKLKGPDKVNTKSCVLRNHSDSNTSFL